MSWKSLAEGRPFARLFLYLCCMKNTNLYTLIALFCITCFAACNNSPRSDYQELDLLSYGIPVSIQAPQDVEIGKEDYGVMQGVWVKGENHSSGIVVRSLWEAHMPLLS